MKKITFILQILTLILGTGFYSLQAANVSLGAQMWFAWWEPAWGNTDYTADPSITVKQSSDLKNPDPAFMKGPLVSVTFYERWIFSLSGAYGGYTTRGVRQPTSSSLVFEELDIKKYDMDTALSYIINPYIKIFAGLKMQGYSYEKKIHQVMEGNPPSYRWEEYKDTSYKSYGPALGIGFSVPLTEKFFTLINFNGLMLFADENTDLVKYYFDTSTPQSMIQHYSYDGKAKIYGANSSLSFGYLIPDSRLTITWGFRYQVLYYVQNKSDAGEYYFDGKTDKFYGIVISAIYSFDI